MQSFLHTHICSYWHVHGLTKIGMIINEHPPGVGQELTMTTPWGMNGWWEAPFFPSRKGEPRGYCVVAIPQERLQACVRVWLLS